MFRWTAANVALAFVIVVLATSSASAQRGKDKDKGDTKTPPQAAHWDWTIYDEKGKEVEKGSFNVRGYALMKNGKRIGVYEDVSETEVKVEVEEGRLKGKLKLTKTKATDVNWEGTLDRENGSSYKVTFSFVKEIK